MRACRFRQRMVVQLGCSCRISIFGKVPNGSEDSALWKRISVASGSHLATTIMATPGKSSDMTVTETAAQPVRRLEWQLAQVREIVVETYRVKSLMLHVPAWQGHLPGQHVDIRLTAADGYQAQRSYSIASPPEDELLSLTVERVDNGEVSPYLVDELRAGDQFEFARVYRRLFRLDGRHTWPPMAHRGWIGDCTADGDAPSPREAEDSYSRFTVVLIQKSRRRHLSSRTRCNGASRFPFACFNTLTRKQPAGWMGRRGRIDKAL